MVRLQHIDIDARLTKSLNKPLLVTCLSKIRAILTKDSRSRAIISVNCKLVRMNYI